MASTERKQVGLPLRNGSALTPSGPTLTTSVNYATAASQSLYRIADRKTPAMADGTLHGNIANLTERGGNYDGQLNT